MCSLLEDAGLAVAAATSRVGTARFDSTDELVQIEIESTPLIERIDGEVYERIVADAREALAAFQTDDGRAEIPIAGHLITASGRAS